MTTLKDRQCEPCHNDSAPMERNEALKQLESLNGWRIESLNGTDRLTKTYKFSQYTKGLEFATAVGSIAEEVGHHPIMTIGWCEVTVDWWTHNINGLHLNDFIMADRCDHL